jgi:hypothetical protein
MLMKLDLTNSTSNVTYSPMTTSRMVANRYDGIFKWKLCIQQRLGISGADCAEIHRQAGEIAQLQHF